MNVDIQFMQRALELAEYGRGAVSPNPMVGCVIVSGGLIIGEGWHRNYGGPHAEVHAIADAEKRNNGHLLSESTVYVTLEPCSHYGKTPPCADLLIRKKVKRVVICNGDPNPLVGGRGIERLRLAGIEVACDLLATEGLALNARFFTFIQEKRPYIILKWAETANGFLAGKNGQPLQISGEFSGVQVHRWRSEEDAILVGFHTALNDNPRLNVRHWKGTDPVRIILDRKLGLPQTHHVFDLHPSIIVNWSRQTGMPEFPERYGSQVDTAYLQVKPGPDELQQLLTALYLRNIQSVIVEGGSQVLSSFLEAGLWDEVRRCQSRQVMGESIPAPVFRGVLKGIREVQDDVWTYYSRK